MLKSYSNTPSTKGFWSLRGMVLVPVIAVAMLISTMAIAKAATVIDFDDFSDLSDFQLNGQAVSLNPNPENQLRLTDNSGGQWGSAFLTSPVNLLNNDGSFSASFSFRIHTPGGGGADGLTFMVQNSTAGAGAGSSGGGLGYLGVDNSLVVEFDTWQNVAGFGQDPAEFGCDINANHVGISIDGNICSVEQLSLDSLGTLEAGDQWFVWVDYDGVGDVVEVRVANEDNNRPTAALISATGIDLPGILGGTDAYIGFTAATGGANAYHEILGTQFEDDLAPITTAPGPAPGTAPLPNPDSGCEFDCEPPGCEDEEDCDPDPGCEDEGDCELGTKAEILSASGVDGKGIGNAPGLDTSFNEKSKAADRAGKKK